MEEEMEKIRSENEVRGESICRAQQLQQREVQIS